MTRHLPARMSRSVSGSDSVTSSTASNLRERKKLKTRAEIRGQALRLFRERGFHETTIHQIADAAEVSVATVFRYFATKETIVLSDELGSTMLAALNDQPSDLEPFTALIRAIEMGLSQLDKDDEQERRALIAAVPELRSAQLDLIKQTVEVLAAALGKRLDRKPDDVEIRIFTGALSGVVVSALGDDVHHPPGLEDIRQAVLYLQTGFPLVGPARRSRTPRRK
jgi:AcrR family transcriptional regulator